MCQSQNISFYEIHRFEFSNDEKDVLDNIGKLQPLSGVY